MTKNLMNEHAVCVLKSDGAVGGHLAKRTTWTSVKTTFYSLREHPKNICTAIVTGKPVNLGDRKGIQIPCR